MSRAREKVEGGPGYNWAVYVHVAFLEKQLTGGRKYITKGYRYPK
jgi:hypothetical protein